MTEVRFYNSLLKRIEPFQPRDTGKVRIYNCGPTVYQRQHIGNMRRFLFADFLRRSLEFWGYEVREVTNITDVGHLTQDEIEAGEDKLEKAAREQKLTPQDIAKKQIELFFEDLKKLNIQPAHAYPKATQHIKQMQVMIRQLIERGHAYQTKTGVYFDVQSFPAYGKLSGNTLEHIEAGQRAQVRKEKKHPADFALWVVDPHHLQKWDSPWGLGYPGWHIECSAMSIEYLGNEIDIHTGGEDNRFPHHENEIAQSEGATGKTFVRVWMHNRHLQFGGRKLAKREGEQITLDTLEERGYPPLAFRLLVFSSHYRSKMDFTWEALAGAAEMLGSIRQLIRRLLEMRADKVEEAIPYEKTVRQFSEALADDLNTPRALASLTEFMHQTNAILSSEKSSKEEIGQLWATIEKLDQVLGIVGPIRREIESEEVPPSILDLVKQREEARAANQFKQADRLRRQVEEQGYKIEDTDSGARVFKAR